MTLSSFLTYFIDEHNKMLFQEPVTKNHQTFEENLKFGKKKKKRKSKQIQEENLLDGGNDDNTRRRELLPASVNILKGTRHFICQLRTAIKKRTFREQKLLFEVKNCESRNVNSVERWNRAKDKIEQREM